MKLNIQRGIAVGTNINDITVPDYLRKKIPTGVEFIDEIFGGKGMTPSMVTLFTGVSGGGKSTLAQMLADGLTGKGGVALFNTGEESLYQVKIVAERLHLRNGFLVGDETYVPTLLEQADAIRALNPNKHFTLIVDSLQCMNDGKYGDGTNSKTPVRALESFTNYAKEHLCNVIVIGQVTKGGKFAGDNKLKHMVDAHMHLDIETKNEELLGCRVLTMPKNRFGGARPEGIYLTMTERGFSSLLNLSAGE